MDDADDTPLSRLIHARLTCERGIADAEACIAAGNEQEWLRPFEAAYRNRQAWWLTTRDAVDRAIAALRVVSDE